MISIRSEQILVRVIPKIYEPLPRDKIRYLILRLVDKTRKGPGEMSNSFVAMF